MNFILVISPVPFETRGDDAMKMGSFYLAAAIETLSKTEGVFCISETAWIFDIRKNLPVFSKVVHEAHVSGVQLYIFQLDREEFRSQMVSNDQSKKLEAFLAP